MSERHEVRSSFVTALEFDPSGVVTVHLKAGSYSVHGVPEADFRAMLNAPSIGTHFNQIFKKKHGGKLKKT